MKRTNIYLDESQAAHLDELARVRGISRSEFIRRLLNDAINRSQTDNLADDLAAIDASFGALQEADDFMLRGPDDRSRHLERIARL